MPDTCASPARQISCESAMPAKDCPAVGHCNACRARSLNAECALGEEGCGYYLPRVSNMPKAIRTRIASSPSPNLQAGALRQCNVHTAGSDGREARVVGAGSKLSARAARPEEHSIQVQRGRACMKLNSLQIGRC